MRRDIDLQVIEAIETGLILVAVDLRGRECVSTPGIKSALGIKLAETCSADSIVLWSWQPYLKLGEVQLLDVSGRECHRWIMPSLELVENSKAWTAWARDYPNAYLAHYVAGCLNGRDAPRIHVMEDAKHGVSVLDFTRDLGLDELRNLNVAAKNCGMTAIVCATLYDAQNRPYRLDTYAELALRICLEHGVNLEECATKIVTLAEGEYDEGEYDTEYQIRVLA